jgi:hypothetical protein
VSELSPAYSFDGRIRSWRLSNTEGTWYASCWAKGQSESCWFISAPHLDPNCTIVLGIYCYNSVSWPLVKRKICYRHDSETLSTHSHLIDPTSYHIKREAKEADNNDF